MVGHRPLTLLVYITCAVFALALLGEGVAVGFDKLGVVERVAGVVTVLAVAMERWLWHWPLFRGWLVSIPDVRGTWQGTLRSSWVNPDTGRALEDRVVYLVVRQTLTTLTARLITSEARSDVIAHSFATVEGGIVLYAVYRGVPDIGLRATGRSRMYHGAWRVEVEGVPARRLRTEYWTDRATTGQINFDARRWKVATNYEMAERMFAS